MDITLAAQPDEDCREFVRRMPSAKLCHMPEWAFMVERELGHKCYYLIARNEHGIQGVLPLSHVKSRLFGNRMVSQAFASYGGPLIDSPDALDSLYQRACELAGELGCESIEFRSDQALPYDLPHRENKVSMRLKLLEDPDELWRSFKSQTKVRNHIRKAQKAGIVVVDGSTEYLQDFYEVYTRRMHQLGTPCYPKALFRGLLESFPENCHLFIGRLGDQTVGARLVFSFNSLVESIWGMTRVEFNRYSPNHLLYWAVFEHYCPGGAQWFDFGPSTAGSGPHDFKKQWGAIPFELFYQYWVPPGAELTVHSPDNPKYRRRVELWKKMPYWLTRVAGPIISRGLP